MVLLEYFMHGYIPDDSSTVDRIIVSEGITTLPQRTLTDAEGDYQVGCFQKYTNLVHCQLPRSFLILPPQTLAYCEKLVEIHIVHTQIKVIEDHAFANCIMLESIFFPVTCVRIGLGAFSRCKALRTCYLPGGLRQIDSQAFAECNLLTNLNLPSPISNCTFGPGVFNGCKCLDHLVKVWPPDQDLTIQWLMKHRYRRRFNFRGVKLVLTMILFLIYKPAKVKYGKCDKMAPQDDKDLFGAVRWIGGLVSDGNLDLANRVMCYMAIDGVDIKPHSNRVFERCAHCKMLVTELKCVCGTAYCDKECQASAWKDHKGIHKARLAVVEKRRRIVEKMEMAKQKVEAAWSVEEKDEERGKEREREKEREKGVERKREREIEREKEEERVRGVEIEKMWEREEEKLREKARAKAMEKTKEEVEGDLERMMDEGLEEAVSKIDITVGKIKKRGKKKNVKRKKEEEKEKEKGGEGVCDDVKDDEEEVIDFQDEGEGEDMIADMLADISNEDAGELEKVLEDLD